MVALAARLFLVALVVMAVIYLVRWYRRGVGRRADFARIAELCAALESGRYASLTDVVGPLDQALRAFVQDRDASPAALQELVDPGAPGHETAARWVRRAREEDRLTHALLEWGRQREAEAREQLVAELPDDERADPDLVTLAEQRLVEVTGTGINHTTVALEVRNLGDESLTIEVRPGTRVHAHAGNHTDMVVREAHPIEMPARGVVTANVKASCLSPGAGIPDAHDAFRGVSRAPRKVRRFLEAVSERPPMVAQVGVWALTDGLAGPQSQELLVRVGADGREHSLITDAHVAEAQAALAALD